MIDMGTAIKHPVPAFCARPG